MFKNQWGLKKDPVYFLTKFEELKSNPSEVVAEFIKRFNKHYHKMPPDCKPLLAAAKVRFSKAFEDEFAIMLRERVSHTLDDMQTNSIEVEANRSTSSKLKAKAEKEERKLKARIDDSSSSKSKLEDQKIDEITYLLRNISNRISKIESQPRTTQQTIVSPQAQTQFQRAPQMQIFQRLGSD